jgi:hypothetical protein
MHTNMDGALILETLCISALDSPFSLENFDAYISWSFKKTIATQHGYVICSMCRVKPKDVSFYKHKDLL